MAPKQSHDEASGLDKAMEKLSLNEAFPFFDLPFELRLRIYQYVLLLPDRIIDLHPDNWRAVLPKLNLLRVSKQMEQEAAKVFYGQHTFRMFPLHGRFFHTREPLLARLVPKYRGLITTTEIRFGPGWGKPPKGQCVNDKLGLESCASLRRLKVLVEIDPSIDIFNGYRGFNGSKEGYSDFCVRLLEQIFERLPNLQTVDIDAWTGVPKDSPLIKAVAAEAEKAKKKVVWGPLRGWFDKNDCGRIGIEGTLASLQLF